MSRNVLARKPYSNVDGDKHLEIVLVEIPNNITPFVTWAYNKQTGGYFWGHYFTNKESALRDFNARPKMTRGANV